MLSRVADDRWLLFHTRRKKMIDKDSLIGIGGTLATFSGSLHEWIGVVAGTLTIIFMGVKLWQEFKKRK